LRRASIRSWPFSSRVVLEDLTEQLSIPVDQDLF
jgi:hypothetical protein